MSNRALEFIEEESSGIHKPTEDSQLEGKTNYDYAKILAEMKKELENIPTKYPNAADNNDISSQKYSEPSESLELNMVKTGDVRNNKEETNNIAYSDDSKKDVSEDNEPYDEDFEQSEDKAQSSNQVATERNESAQSYSRESPNPAKTNLQATVKRDKSSPMKKNTSQEDDYENDDFEEEVVDDDISEIKRESIVSSKRSTPPPVVAVTKKDDKKPAAPASKTNQNNSKPPQPVQSNSAKNFKIKPGPTPVNKDVKKEPTARPSSSKEPIKQPAQPSKDPKTVTKPPLKRPATAKAALSKTTAILNMKNSKPNKEPAAAKDLAKTTTDKVDKVDEDFEFVEEEEMVADQNANPTATKAKASDKMQERPQTVGAKSREQVSNNDEEIVEEEDVQGTETKAKNKFKPVKKVEHKDIMKQIFDSFKKKEEINQKKDENIYATEEVDKRVKTAGAPAKNKAEDQENKWVGNGLGLTTSVADATKKGKTTSSANTKPESGSTQSFAQKFLTSLENKFKKVPKLGQTTTATGQEETKEEDQKKRAQSAKKGGSQTDLQKTWKYNVGSGVNSEYEKTQKAKEKESQKRFTELFKKEKNKAKDQKKENLTKIKEIMNRERENRKAIEEKFVKNMRTGNKGDNKESRDPLVLQVQNVYLEEEERNKREKQKEEINQLKLKLKLLKQQNQGLQKDLVDLQHRDSNAGRQLDSLASKKAVIMIGKNEFASLNSHLIPKERSKASTTARSGQATDRSNILEDENPVINLDKLSPIEIIINKFADQELELEEIYQLLDKNGDGILTLKEIKEGLEKLNLDLDETEIGHIITVVDANTDGTITCEEFVSSLKESLAVRKDYKSIMGDLDKITNPIVLEERILDMETRKKLIEEDTKKVTDELKVHEYGYKKLLKKLQEFEGMAGPQKETKTDLDHIRNIIIRLKVEIQDAEDMKSRIELMQDERMKDITENIQTLEEKIERTIRRIQEEKRKAKDLAQEQQKEELRKIFMMKAFGEIEREMETFDSGLDKNVQKMIEEKQRLQAKREEEENMNALDGHIQNGAAIKIQKIYRGSVSRRKAQNVSLALLKAKTVILKRWRAHKKRVKTMSLASKIKGLLRKVLGSAFENLRKHSQEKAEEQQEKARLKEQKNQASPAGANKKPLGRTPTGERDDDELSQLSGVGENGVPLYTVLYLQDLARKKLGKETPEDKLLYRKTNKKVQKCGVCRKEPVERVCKECEIAVFCTKCFATTHKSRKNHPFIEVKTKPNDEKTMNMIESKDPEMAAELNYLQEKYQNEFKNLIAHMRDWDLENAGYFDIRGFRETLKRKVKDENELDFLVKVAKTYCKKDSQDLQIDYVSFANLVCS